MHNGITEPFKSPARRLAAGLFYLLYFYQTRDTDCSPRGSVI